MCKTQNNVPRTWATATFAMFSFFVASCLALLLFLAEKPLPLYIGNGSLKEPPGPTATFQGTSRNHPEAPKEPQGPPKSSQGATRSSQEHLQAPKHIPRSPGESPRTPKQPPGVPKEHPWNPQGPPRSPQAPLESSQGAPMDPKDHRKVPPSSLPSYSSLPLPCSCLPPSSLLPPFSRPFANFRHLLLANQSVHQSLGSL